MFPVDPSVVMAGARNLLIEQTLLLSPFALEPLGIVPRGGEGEELRHLAQAARWGRDYLAQAAEPRGIQSVIGLDAAFERTIEATDLRAFVQERLGADIGFDAGDEAFSSMMALKLFCDDHAAAATLARSLGVVRRQAWRGRYRFFCERNGFAADTDCTAVAAASLHEMKALTTEELLASGRELLLAAAPESVPASENLDEATGKSNGELRAGVVMVYWEDGQEPGAAPRDRKQDAAVAANALYTLVLAREARLEDAGGVIEATLGYVSEHLRSGAYLAGTRYYPSPDTFLFYVSCLCRRFRACLVELGADMRRALALRDSMAPRPGTPEDPTGALNLAQRVLAACNLGVRAGLRQNLEDLLELQRSDGSWPATPFYSLGKRALYFGSPAVTTMFATKALAAGLAAAPRPGTRAGRHSTIAAENGSWSASP